MNSLITLINRAIFKRSIKVHITILLVLLSIHTLAGIEPVLKKVRTGTKIGIDSVLEIKDYYSINNKLDSFCLYRASNRLRLEINHENISECLSSTFSLRVKVSISKKDSLGNTTTDTVTLSINYNSNSGEYFTDAATYDFENSYETTVTVTDIISSGYLPFVKLTLEMEIERYRKMDLSLIPQMNQISYDNVTGELIITWETVQGAEEYDLEWQYIDNVSEVQGESSSAPVMIDFSDNATRVSVKQNNYRISNIFDIGYAVFRVRATTKAGRHFTHRLNGLWSDTYYNKNLLSSSDTHYVENEDYYKITSALVHEDSINWQIITTFAEQGLKKEVITYMDGLFRGRQTVTRNNSDTMAVVGDFYYDHQNRQTIAVLPVPAFDKKINYHKNFNKVKGRGTVLKPRDYLKDTSFCTLPNPRLDSTSGAGRYYSSANPLIGSSNNTGYGNNRYIPHAFGYAYTKTEYYPDPTNRVRRQGGVGATHQIGSTHETQYIYATARREELDPLFGNDVGWAEHYQKQMVIDPNGQVSISYTNLAGKTIATALAGDNTDFTQALSTYNTESKRFNLLSPNDSLYSDYSLNSYQELAVEKAGYYYFNYKVNAGRLENGCTANLCYDCIYDLTISVKDECGVELLDGNSVLEGTQPLVVRIGKKLSELETQCESGSVGFDFNNKTDSIPDSIAVYLNVGKYTITKNLAVNLTAARMYADSMLKYNTCIKTVEEYKEDILGKMDIWGCNLSCEECETKLGTFKQFMKNEKLRLFNDSNYTVPLYDSAYFKNIYQARADICSTMCTQSSPCEFIYKMLLADVSEAGQYPDSPITSHPEYCHYLNCIAADSGRLYDAAMMSIDNYEDAEQAGYMNPLNDNNISYTGGNADPYFNASGQSAKNAMSAYLNNIPKTDGNSSGYNAWQWALLAVRANHLESTGDINTFLNNATAGGDACNDVNDLIWRTFRAMYLSKKTQIYEANQSNCYQVSLPQGKERLFDKTTQLKSDLTSGHSDEADAVNDNMIQNCDSNCWYQVDNWLEQLGDCQFGTQTQKDSIIRALVQVCIRGCDDNNPYGSSSVDMSKHATAKYRTFGEVLRLRGIYVKGLCDSNLLEAPLPFNQSNHYLQKDTTCCDCDFDTCTNRLKDSHYKKLIKYAIKQKRDTVCRECKDCDEIGKAVYRFYKTYPNITFSAQLNFRDLFENFMNRDLRFNLSYHEYLNFMGECIGVKDSLYNDSIIYKKFYDNYYKYDFEIPTGYIANIDKKQLRYNPWQSNEQYASTNANVYEIDNTNRIDTCLCNKIFDKLVQCNFAKTHGYADNEIDSVMDLIGCTFTNKFFVFKTCLAAAARDTAFLSGSMIIHSTTTWKEGQINYLRDEVETDQQTLRDSLIITGTCNWKCEVRDEGTTDVLPFVSLTLYMKPFEYVPCDTIKKWVLKYLSRKPDKDKNTQLTEMANDWNIQKKFAQYLDSCYLKKSITRLINYNSFNSADSSALTYHVFKFLRDFLECQSEGQLLNLPWYDSPGCPCLTQKKKANLFLNFLKQMSGRSAWSNYLSMDAIRLKAYSLESFYKSELYTGTDSNKLIHSRVSNVSKWYRKFKISDYTTYTLYYDLSFLQPKDEYNFGGIINFFDLRVLKNGCNTLSNRFVVKAIVKGVYPSLDTVELFGTIDFMNLLEFDCNARLCNRQINELDYKPDSCTKSYENLAEYYAKQYYYRYTDSLKRDFINRYIAKCKNHARQTEEFTVDFTRAVYHYTLYYYDQLGNLIQTVPPQGVQLLSGVALDSVYEARKKQTRTPYYPSHTFNTRYKYNTLNQLIWQATPDAGQSVFWYDRLGRLVVSQNAQQNSTTSAMPNKRYSYTLYDSLGRIKEVGENTNTLAMTNSLAYDYLGFVTWVGSGGRSQITRTYYDRVKFGEGRTGFKQENLRSRVASITIQQAEDTAFDQAVHYNYDIHGNVSSMVRQNNNLINLGHHLKKLDYEYDLISGKVNKVVYQKDKVDQFIHSYTYDAENRIKNANTSTDNVHFETDARYTYYKHGPLARTEIGRLYVQGVDYIYTLQGWLKGVNTTSVAAHRDPGKDGNAASPNMYVCNDEYGFSLRYYAGDYTPINISINNADYFDFKQNNTSFASASANLYNGNISNMVTGIRQLTEPTLGRAFKYDQLNRIKEAFSFTSPDSTNNQWGASQASDSSWYESFSYDANGNITKLKRKGNNSSHYMMDNFAYNYQSGTNKLTSVDDQVAASNYSIDIDDQSSNNYKYDHIGNLTVDVAEGIDSIQWNVYGKIRSITRSTAFYQDSLRANLSFDYTPDGHRSSKGVSIYQKETEYTYYVRDAQGNVMAVYELKNTKDLDSSQLTIENINQSLIATSSVQTFAEFCTDELGLHNHASLPDDYILEVIQNIKTAEVLLAFEPHDYLLNVNTTLQNPVLANYSTTAVLQALADELGYSSFYSTIMPAVCTDNGALNVLISFRGVNNFLSDWHSYNSSELLSMAADYDNWLVANSYGPPYIPPINTLTDVQNLVATQSLSRFCTYLAQASTYHTSVTQILTNIQQSDFIQQLGSLATLMTNVVQVQFSASEIFTSLSHAGKATLWSYIITEAANNQGLLAHYRTNNTQEFVKQCIIVLPSYVDSYITETVSQYLQKIRSYYNTEQYASLMAALTELYYTPSQTLQLAEWHVYGSSRLGIYKANKPLAKTINETIVAIQYQTRIKYRYNGKKQYELSNHLGNVLVTISDRRKAICNEVDSTLSYQAVVVTATDYYAFGSPLIGRTYQAESLVKYRYGFNGKELDKEGMGGGQSTYDYGFRIYNSWIIKFLSVDPLTKNYPWNSTYAFAENKPIVGVDLDGCEFMPIHSSMFQHKYYGSTLITSYLDPNQKVIFSSLLIHEYDVVKVGKNLPKYYKEIADINNTGPFGLDESESNGYSEGTTPSPISIEIVDDGFEEQRISTNRYINLQREKPIKDLSKGQGILLLKEFLYGLVDFFHTSALIEDQKKVRKNKAYFYDAYNLINLEINLDKGLLKNTPQFQYGEGFSAMINYLVDGTIQTGKTFSTDDLVTLGNAILSRQNIPIQDIERDLINATFEINSSTYSDLFGSPEDFSVK